MCFSICINPKSAFAIGAIIGLGYIIHIQKKKIESLQNQLNMLKQSVSE